MPHTKTDNDEVRDTIEVAYGSVKKVLETDTDVTVSSFDVLTRANWSAVKKYTYYKETVEQLDHDRKNIKEMSK